MLEKVRIDKWLWSVRIFKTRTMATDVIRSGKVKVNDKVVKPSYLLQVGETVIVGKNGFNFCFKVVELIQKRVNATLAQACYVDQTSPDELNKYTEWFVGKRGVEAREKGTGRPTKKERREIDDYKGDQLYDWDDWEIEVD